MARATLLILVLLQLAVGAQSYDPLQEKDQASKSLELTVGKLPVLVYVPPGTGPAPVVLVSHGLGGSRHIASYLGQHWSNRGYVVIFLQHPGSDESIWKDKPAGQRLQALQQAANGKNLELRVEHVKTVLDALPGWNQKGPLQGRLDLAHIGMSGHSFGAVTTQAVSGQVYPVVGSSWNDSRIRAAIAFSPSIPRAGEVGKAFARVRLPWLLMTGTEDTAPIGGMTVQDRRSVYPALPAGDKYELVMDGAEHSVFTDRSRQNPRYHQEILAFSTAFWDAYLKGNPEARAWLQGPAARAALAPKDNWQYK